MLAPPPLSGEILEGFRVWLAALAVQGAVVVSSNGRLHFTGQTVERRGVRTYAVLSGVDSEQAEPESKMLDLLSEGDHYII